MSIAKKAVIFLGACLAFLAVEAVLSWYFYPWSGNVSVKIKELVREKRVTTFDLKVVASFPWTEVYLFGPYQMREDICLVLGLTGFECWWVAPAMVDESHDFLVFRNDQEIVHREHHALYHGDFSFGGQPRPLRHHDAHFIIVQGSKMTTGDVWLYLEHRAPSSNFGLHAVIVGADELKR